MDGWMDGSLNGFVAHRWRWMLPGAGKDRVRQVSRRGSAVVGFAVARGAGTAPGVPSNDGWRQLADAACSRHPRISLQHPIRGPVKKLLL